MKIDINKFTGIMPKIANDKLPIDIAQTMHDAKTTSGELVAYNLPVKDSEGYDPELTGSSYKSFFPYNALGATYWAYYDLITHHAQSTIEQDIFERVYFTGTGTYRAFANDLIGGSWDQDTAYYTPGAPSGTALSAGGYTTGSGVRSYFYTYVSRYGEEGPPSAILELTDYGSGTVNLTGFQEPPSADGHLTDAVAGERPKVRIYRTVVGSTSAEFQYVGEFYCDGINWSTYSFADNVADSDLGEVNTTTYYDRAPSGIANLNAHPNGFFVASKSNYILFTEPYQLHAWPEDYRISFDSDVMAVGLFGSTIVVMTNSFVYTLSGPHPDSMYRTRLGFQPCLYNGATVNTDMGVLFPSAEGFQLVNSSGIQNITADKFDPADWEDYYLDSMLGVYYNKSYYGFFRGEDAEGYIRIDFINNRITTGQHYHYGANVSEYDGVFRTITNSDPSTPSTLYRSLWDAIPEMFLNYLYKSPRFVISKPANFKVAQVLMDTDFYDEVIDRFEDEDVIKDFNAALWASGLFYSQVNWFQVNGQQVNGDGLIRLLNVGVQDFIEFRVYVKSVLQFTKQVRNNSIFKLPRGFKSQEWEIEVVGMIPIKRIIMATSTEEIV